MEREQTMTDHADIEAMIVNKITLGTRRQYAEQSKAWKNGEGEGDDPDDRRSV